MARVSKGTDANLARTYLSFLTAEIYLITGPKTKALMLEAPSANIVASR